uniref:Histone acetyltransferase type B catalytic subunit n=1 Tax=Ditylenchus dipsaci TaxID=166011 RepID=A0A915ERW4_9BILA
MQLERENNFEAYIVDALKAVSLKFVESTEDIEEAPGFEPEFAHQHFGETENIIGFKGLEVSVCYSDCTLFIYPRIHYESVIPADSELKADDILYKIRDQLPSSQLDGLVSSLSSYQIKLNQQKRFKPYGELISKFYFDDSYDGLKKEIQIYKVEYTEDEDVHRYIERAQSLAFWYIDGASYTDNDDPRFFHYFAFESTKHEEDGSRKYKFAGYSSLYRFYYHPDKDRVRIAHMLLSPPYRQQGNGIRFLNAIYSDLRSREKVYDITAESFADNFLFMRDFADCVSCAELPEFSKDHLLKGYTKKMSEAALKKLKLHQAQTRRIYEILRFNCTPPDQQSQAEYKADVVKRIEKPLKRSKRDLSKLTEALNPKELAVVAKNLDGDQQKQLIEEQYNNTVDSYKIVLNRLKSMKQRNF